MISTINFLKKLLVFFCISFIFLIVATNSYGQKIYTGQEVFGPIITDLNNSTNVPAKLPNYMGHEYAADPNGFIGKIQEVNSNNYLVYVVTRPECQGETFCTDGIVTGEHVGSNASLPSTGVSITLANNIQGKFEKTVCGASCSMAKIFWIENSYLYSVQFKALLKNDMLNIANSAITDNVAN